jgi:hypothetical protein
MKLSVGSYDNSTTVDNEAEILADFQHEVSKHISAAKIS